ncbi:DUF1648 domain-containing protein [Geomicrobium sp. JCM 19038]|uniref:DUF1648 domain-containing protein n=1 Tax=Geomicrobium sp. JCM 19038 TaxID=1460635 RepID=UPI001268C69B|nr:DUF1648 domain-containing protein [Geomicrobium sp. JCM 19038]
MKTNGDVEYPKVAASTVEKVVYTVTIVSVIIFILFLGWSLSQLPSEVPIHRSFSGEITYGSPVSFIFLPIIAIATSLFLFGSRFLVSLFNFPVEVTDGNIRILIILTRNMIAHMALVTTAIFFAIYIEALFITNEQPMLGIAATVVWMKIVIIYYFVKIIKKGKAYREGSAEEDG